MLLNCHTYYSFKYGTISTEELIKESVAKGYESVALTDINNTSACFDFLRLSPSGNLKPVIGIDFRNGIRQKYIGIAKNLDGFYELNEHLTYHLHNKKDFHSRAPEFNNAYIIYPFYTNEFEMLKENEFVGIHPGNLKYLQFLSKNNYTSKSVILHPVTFRNKQDYNTHRLLRAIDKNTLLSKLSPDEQTSSDEVFISRNELDSVFYEYPDIITNTEKLLENCRYSFNFNKNKNKQFLTNSITDDYKLLESECKKGLQFRYGKADKTVIDRMNKELNIIRDFGFCSYFLINWDIVRYAQRKGYYYVGRGSGANSMVAYLLRITNVDPVELDLYFERFINPYRSNPPDFDIDFSWTDRDDIIKYIFNRFGWQNTALLGTYITYNHKSAFREIGKVFGIPAEEITRLQKNPDYNRADKYGKWVIRYSDLISGFPSHLSIHASGILISELPVYNYTATHILPKGFPSTQFDMQVAEDIGLYKFDILSQRGLGKIKDSLDIIRNNKNAEVRLDDISGLKQDKKIRDLLKTGNAIGCFYIESPAMRMLLTKLKADDYKSLVAASSIIRPGVARSGMMREYIERFRSLEKRNKAKNEIPELYEILKDTYGVMVYQEDVIKVAHYFAGLSLAEADVLRRGMSWKFRQRNEFWKVRDKFFMNCIKKGYNESTIKTIWEQIESFANYAFAKGHSASYAVESFQALYLKAHFPLEYITATLNNGGGFYSPQLYIYEAKKLGAIIELPCINKSEWLNRIENNTIYLGFYLLHQMEKETISLILKERKINGEFTGLSDFMKRVPIHPEQLLILIRIGAFRFTGIEKKELIWQIHRIKNKRKSLMTTGRLFEHEVKEFKIPELWKHELEDQFDEMELTGFTISSPYSLIKNIKESEIESVNLKNKIDKQIIVICYLIHRKYTRTNKGDVMYFGTWLDKERKWVDTVHFPDSIRKYPFTGPGCYQIEGKVVEEYGFISIEVKKMFRLEYRSLDN